MFTSQDRARIADIAVKGAFMRIAAVAVPTPTVSGILSRVRSPFFRKICLLDPRFKMFESSLLSLVLLVFMSFLASSLMRMWFCIVSLKN